MDMDKAELSRACERIVSGKSFYQLDNNCLLEIFDPSVLDKQEASFFAKQYQESLELDDVPSLDYMKIFAAEIGIWKPEYDKFIQEYPDKKRDLLNEIKRLEFRSVEKLKPQTALKKLEKQLNHIEEMRFLIEQNSADYLVHAFKNRYYVWKNTFQNGQRHFASYTFEQFFDQVDGKLIDKIIQECFFPKHITEKIIRKIARNEPWRSIWVTALKTGQLFSKPAVELSDLQRALISWSIIYDNSFESMEPPSDEVVEDDALFDAWMHAKREESDRKRATSKTSLGMPVKAGDKAEVGIVVNTPEDAKRVWAMNNKATQHQITKNQQSINEKGIVKETYLPDSQQLMRNKLAESRK
jgi:hypothetical protein